MKLLKASFLFPFIITPVSPQIWIQTDPFSLWKSLTIPLFHSRHLWKHMCVSFWGTYRPGSQQSGPCFCNTCFCETTTTANKQKTVLLKQLSSFVYILSSSVFRLKAKLDNDREALMPRKTEMFTALSRSSAQCGRHSWPCSWCTVWGSVCLQDAFPPPQAVLSDILTLNCCWVPASWHGQSVLHTSTPLVKDSQSVSAKRTHEYCLICHPFQIAFHGGPLPRAVTEWNFLTPNAPRVGGQYQGHWIWLLFGFLFWVLCFFLVGRCWNPWTRSVTCKIIISLTIKVIHGYCRESEVYGRLWRTKENHLLNVLEVSGLTFWWVAFSPWYCVFCKHLYINSSFSLSFLIHRSGWWLIFLDLIHIHILTYMMLGLLQILTSWIFPIYIFVTTGLMSLSSYNVSCGQTGACLTFSTVWLSLYPNPTPLYLPAVEEEQEIPDRILLYF